jgi:hypothetical protein
LGMLKTLFQIMKQNFCNIFREKILARFRRNFIS